MALSPSIKAALRSSNRDDPHLICAVVEIGGTTLRIVRNTEPITRADGDYVAIPFSFGLDTARGIVQGAEFSVVNWGDADDETLTEEQRAVFRTPYQIFEGQPAGVIPTVTLFGVLASEPDTIVWGPKRCRLTDVKVTAAAVTGTLSGDIYGMGLEIFPGIVAGPAVVPGVHR